MITRTLFSVVARCQVVVLLAWLSACSEHEDIKPASGFTVTTEMPNSFLRVPDQQVPLVAGVYQVVAAAPLGASGSYQLQLTFDDGATQSFSGNWISAGGENSPQANGNPRHDFTMNKPGGIQVQLNSTSITTPMVYVLKNGFIISGPTGAAIEHSSAIALHANKISNADHSAAYYAKVDPYNERTTLADWKQKNGFDNGEDVHVIFRDAKDLGYGRNMRARRNADGSIAIFVENYIVALRSGDPGNYGILNVEAAVREDRRFHVGSNAIEFSPIDQDDPSSPKVLKFFTFKPESSAPGARQNRLLAADLDGRGVKPVPGTCLTCHGARLTPLKGDGSLADMTLHTAKYNQIEPELVEYSSAPGFEKEDMLAGLRIINEMVREAYLSQQAYDDTMNAKWYSDFAIALSRGRFPEGGGITYNPNYIPSGWQQNGSRPEGVDLLWKKVIEPHCIACHALQGNLVGEKIKVDVKGSMQSLANAVNFDSYEKFIAHEPQIIDYVFRRGIMPLGLRNYLAFWDKPSEQATLLASFLPNFDLFENGAVLEPGKPVARPGNNRTVVSPVQLNGSASTLAVSYAWSIVSTPLGATASLSNPTIAAPMLTANMNGEYVLRLSVSNAKGSHTADTTITVDAAMTAPQTALNFVEHIKPILGSDSATLCASCHQPATTFNESLRDFPGIPVYYVSEVSPGVPNVNLYRDVLARVNLAEPENSRLLRKPTGLRHGGSIQIDLSTELGKNNYNTILNWVREGAPCGNDPVICP